MRVHPLRSISSCPLGGRDDVRLVPLPGHTFGHAGVAVRSGGRWLLHAGDAYFHKRTMDVHNRWCTPGLRTDQTMLNMDRAARLHNQRRLRVLRHDKGSAVDVFSAHDVAEFERLSGQTARAPITPVGPGQHLSGHMP